MITFTRVKYQNFLASGNAPIELTLNEHPTTLIIGKNGSGKSTMSEAICFALFGRPLRSVNKPLLVNSINGRDCVVELDFQIGSAQYRVKRGIKPNLFEVYSAGVLIPSPASAQDYQTMLETNILHLNYKSFMQVVVLGSASYVPFMRLAAGARRSIIEDLLDIEVFSSMNALAKDELSNIKVELDKCVQAQRLIGEQRKMAQSFTEHLEEKRAQTIAQIQDAIVRQQNELGDYESQQTGLQVALRAFIPIETQRDSASAKVQEYSRKLVTIQNLLKKLRKERAFYEEHDNCPTCNQSITPTFKEERAALSAKTEEDASKAAAQCEQLVAKYEGQQEAAEQSLQEAADIKRKMHALDGKLPLVRSRIKDLEASLRDVQTANTQPTTACVNIADLDHELVNLEGQHAQYSRKRVIVDAANMLLKDNGIKARIVKHYLPIINKTINHYLTAMDFPILFTLDEEFQEQIKSRHRDEFAYDSFSEGEKKRIDLALLLTWRAVAKLKNSAATNLLILDEVFDSSLDAGGTEEFLKIIGAMEQDTNVFVISHKGDQLNDKFAHVVAFEKNRGFSQLKA